MRIQFQNIKCCEWIHLFPSVCFYIKGKRKGNSSTFRTFFPKHSRGIQVLMIWLWFEILIETENNNIYYER